MKNIFRGNRFVSHIPAASSCENGGLVVLVHGLMHSGFYMMPLARYLAKHGYECFCYDYRTTRGDVRRHGENFRQRLGELLAAHPGRKLHIVTHSLGGLVTRQALSDPAFPRERIGRVVMLAPPNRGSKVASLCLKLIPGSRVLVRTLDDLSFGESSPVHRIPVPEGVEIGVMVASYDILVPRCSTALDGQRDGVTVFSGHTYMMLRPNVMRQALAFLRDGRFIHPAPSAK
jgi:pimeloyl-ACP methyl ester carboxylesterase